MKFEVRRAVLALALAGRALGFLPQSRRGFTSSRSRLALSLTTLEGSTSSNDEFATLKVDELKALCKEKGLKVGGKKADLVLRLQEASTEASVIASVVGQSSVGGVAEVPAPVQQTETAVAKKKKGGSLLTDDDLFSENSDAPVPQYVDPTRKPRAPRSFEGGGGGGSFSSSSSSSSSRGGPVRDFGPLGHDYARMPEDAATGRSLSAEDEAKINALLGERLQAKLRRDFRTADDLQAQLRRLFTVEVHDGLKQWRADGESDFHGSGARGGAGGGRSFDGGDGGGGARNKYVYERAGPDCGGVVDEAAVTALIDARGTAKIEGDFAQADALRDQLVKEHGVEVNDRSRKWVWCDPSVGHPFAPLKGALTNALVQGDATAADSADGSGSGDDGGSGVLLEEVNALLKKRYEAKRARDFRGADAAQDELRAKGVEVDDFEYSWRYNEANAMP